MALKDWKLKRSRDPNKYPYFWSKDAVSVTVSKTTTRYPDFPSHWRVSVTNVYKASIEVVPDRFFKTKSQALAYAKAYMRKH